MANKFTSWTLGGKACILADLGAYPRASGLANGYWCPLGPEPGVAHVLMKRGDLETLSLNSKLTLRINDSKSVSFPGLWYINAVAVSSGPALNASRVYLVKLADSRYMLKKFGGTLNKGYNVHGYVSLRDLTDTTTDLLPEDCYSESLNSGALWTWATMLENIWNLLPNAGTFPGLPATPAGNPEGFHFTGESTWAAFNAILDHVNFALQYNPLTDAFAIVDLRTSQSGLSNALTANGLPMLDYAPYAGVASHFPASVVNHYPEGTSQYGAFDDAPLDDNYLFGAELAESATTSKTGAVTGTKIDLYDNRQMRTDDPLLPKTSRTTETTQRKTDWLARQNTSESYAHLEYQGVVSNVLPGSQVKAVHWHNFGDGTRTEIARFPGMPSANRSLYLPGPMKEGETECFKWLDVARKGKPVYPHVCQWVKLYSGTPNSDGLYEAKIYRLNAEIGPVDVDQVNQADCFVWFADDGRWSNHKKVPRKDGSLILARIAGSIRSNSETRILLVAQENVANVIGKLTATFSTGSNTVNVWSGTAGAEAVVSGLTITAYPWQEIPCTWPISSTAKVQCTYVGGVWYFKPLPLDYRQISGYSGSVVQYLKHDASGCLAWETPSAC